MTESASQDINPRATLHCDVIIVGGGVAGLWLLNLLRQRGYNALLCEAKALGSAQSIASQGMIHGGIKYALGAALTGASEAIARMPDRWRRCIKGSNAEGLNADDPNPVDQGDVDLRNVEVVAHQYHMWSDGKLGKLSSFFASRALRGRVDALQADQFPSVFRTPRFTGTVHALNDLVLDVHSLIQTLRDGHHNNILAGQVEEAVFNSNGAIESLKLRDGRAIIANQFIFAAGAGNSSFSDALRQAGHKNAPATQLRPLHQVFVQHPQLQELYAHCITGIRSAEPRMTITSHPLDPDKKRGSGNIGWYIGGHLATAGVDRSSDAQIETTRKELTTTLPWIDWSTARISTLRIDRAEPQQKMGAKPDEACLATCGNAMLCWPTKLSLVPDLGDQVLAAIKPPAPLSDKAPEKAPEKTQPLNQRVPIAQPPWLRG